MVADAELELGGDARLALREVPVALETEPEELALAGAEAELGAAPAAVELEADDVVGQLVHRRADEVAELGELVRDLHAELEAWARRGVVPALAERDLEAR